MSMFVLCDEIVNHAPDARKMPDATYKSCNNRKVLEECTRGQREQDDKRSLKFEMYEMVISSTKAGKSRAA